MGEELIRPRRAHLAGLKLNRLRLHTCIRTIRAMAPLEICEERSKPVMFHAGYSWEPNTPPSTWSLSASRDVAVNYLKACLAHMGLAPGRDHHDADEALPT